jgi:hypothetical protein
MDREQHVVQDAAEVYSVFVMQRAAEEMQKAAQQSSSDRLEDFYQYLDEAGLTLNDFESGRYRQYKVNADLQLPKFVERISAALDSSRLGFINVEKEFRNRGLKGDFVLSYGEGADEIPVSLKNYIGSGGVSRPQVGSGTFASFAASFVFERVGVGAYLDPTSGDPFRGSDVEQRTRILLATNRGDLVPLLAVLDQVQAEVREEFLGPSGVHYDQAKVKAAAQRVASMGIDATLELFQRLSIDHVRSVFLARTGLDGEEEALFFDDQRYVDSITTREYHELRQRLNDPGAKLDISRQGQGIRFEFSDAEGPILRTDVPYTINTNGAWYRPKERYSGTRQYLDKGHLVDLAWGQRRPYKSREIATSVNMYVDLAKAGIFDKS